MPRPGQQESQAPSLEAERRRIDAHWREQIESINYIERAALNKLFMLCGGGAAASLAFVGTSSKTIGTSPWMLGALICFAAGIVFSGLLHAAIFYQLVARHFRWKSMAKAVYNGLRQPRELWALESSVFKPLYLVPNILAWMSFLMVICGFVCMGFAIAGQSDNPGKIPLPQN